MYVDQTVTLIGASLSEPHNDRFNKDCVSIYLFVAIRPFRKRGIQFVLHEIQKFEFLHNITYRLHVET